MTFAMHASLNHPDRPPSQPISSIPNNNIILLNPRPNQPAPAPDPAPACPPKPDIHALDPTVVEAMMTGTVRDKQILLQAESEMGKFICSPLQRQPLGSALSSSLNSYQRMLVHRLGDSFGIKRVIEAGHIVIERSLNSACPSVRLETLIVRQDASPSNADRAGGSAEQSNGHPSGVPADKSDHSSASSLTSALPATSPSTAPKAFKIMSRTPSQRSSSRQTSKSLLTSAASSASSLDGNFSESKRSELSYEARQAAYQEARNRIFAGPTASENGTGDSLADSASSSGAGPDEDGPASADNGIQKAPHMAGSSSSDSGRAREPEASQPAAATTQKAKEKPDSAARAVKLAAKLRPGATTFDPTAKAHGYEEVTIIDSDSQPMTMSLKGPTGYANPAGLVSYPNGFSRDLRLGPSPNQHKVYPIGPPVPPAGHHHHPYRAPPQQVGPYGMPHHMAPHYPIMSAPFPPHFVPPYHPSPEAVRAMDYRPGAPPGPSDVSSGQLSAHDRQAEGPQQLHTVSSGVYPGPPMHTKMVGPDVGFGPAPPPMTSDGRLYDGSSYGPMPPSHLHPMAEHGAPPNGGAAVSGPPYAPSPHGSAPGRQQPCGLQQQQPNGYGFHNNMAHGRGMRDGGAQSSHVQQPVGYLGPQPAGMSVHYGGVQGPGAWTGLAPPQTLPSVGQTRGGCRPGSSRSSASTDSASVLTSASGTNVGRGVAGLTVGGSGGGGGAQERVGRGRSSGAQEGAGTGMQQGPGGGMNHPLPEKPVWGFGGPAAASTAGGAHGTLAATVVVGDGRGGPAPGSVIGSG